MSYVADALVVTGLLVLTVAVVGVARFGDLHGQLHASSKAASFGVIALLVAAALSGDGGIIARAVLITVLLALTTPVAAHAIAQAAWLREETVEREEPRG